MKVAQRRAFPWALRKRLRSAGGSQASDRDYRKSSESTLPCQCASRIRIVMNTPIVSRSIGMENDARDPAPFSAAGVLAKT
jgi:hypothetical protein